MTINEWCNANYYKLGEACRNIAKNDPLHEELLHYTVSEFLLKPNVQDIIDSEGAYWFCIRIATNSWWSSTSPFYRTYRTINESIENLPETSVIDIPYDEEEMLRQIHNELSKLSWYDRMLFEAFADMNQNSSLLARETSIPRTSISLTVKRVRKHLKQKLKYE